jgi:hypothetical protein
MAVRGTLEGISLVKSRESVVAFFDFAEFRSSDSALSALHNIRHAVVITVNVFAFILSFSFRLTY